MNSSKINKVLNQKILKVQKELRRFSSPEKAKNASRFFKTGPGEYGEGDLFLGVTIPELRTLAKTHSKIITRKDHITLLKSPYHEDRLLGFLILVLQYEKNESSHFTNFKSVRDLNYKKQIIEFYLKHKYALNNWDLVDLTAYKILGHYIYTTQDPQKIKYLKQLSQSKRHWDRRIAMVATLYLIKKNEFELTYLFAQQNLKDKEDLMHKATGWMLREVGKKNSVSQKVFVLKFAHQMPRTMLRYAIEKWPLSERTKILKQSKK